LSCNSAGRVCRAVLLNEKTRDANQYRGFSGADKRWRKRNERRKGTSKVQSVFDNKKPPVLPRGFLLREQDSNLQPCGYGRLSGFHRSPDYLIILPCVRQIRMSGACGAYWRESSSPSLCTFPATLCSLCGASLRIALSRLWRELGFPEFTRFFNPGYPGKLLLPHGFFPCSAHSRMLYH